MDYGALPPEITSALLYTGPGSAPLVAAASAWNGLAAELNSAAMAYETVVTELAGQEWLGPASASMAEAATPYAAWMGTTGAQAEKAASQATAAAAAFESAFAAVVPPPLIAQNRALLSQALMTNVLGQNTNIIAALEAQYGQMWAQNAATMYQYAGSSATASAVQPFAPPPQVANPAASATQALAAAAPADSVSDTLNNLVTQLNGQLAALANPLTDPMFAQWFNLLGLPTLSNTSANFLTFPATSIDGSILTGLGGSNILSPRNSSVCSGTLLAPPTTSRVCRISRPVWPILAFRSKRQSPRRQRAAAPAAAAAGHAAAAAGAGAGGVAAGLRSAVSVGGLSTPPAWGATLASAHTAGALPVSTISAAPEAVGGSNVVNGMPFAGTGGRGGLVGPRYGFKPTVMARPLTGG